VLRKALQEKLDSLRDSTSALAGQLQFALQPGTAKRPASPVGWRKAVAEGGDAESGRRMFLSAQTGCTMCHQAQGRGTSIGPDLSNVARSLDRAKLIEAILEPSREVAPQYEHHIVETKSGATYSGVLIHSALDGSPLNKALGAGRVRVPIAQVTRHDTSTLSMMPAGLENAMTVHDFRDLLAFLLTLKTGQASPAAK
jgi:putative heme-binding domain-containing protein